MSDIKTRINRNSKVCHFFLIRISSIKIHINFLKLIFYLSHYVISSIFEAAGEALATVQEQLQEVKMDCKTRNSLKKK